MITSLHKKIFATVAITTALASIAPAAAHAAMRGGIQGPISVTTPPANPGVTPTNPPAQYRVDAVKFHANDQSGVDWIGSDSPYWIFSSIGAPGTARTTKSHVYGGVHTGTTRSFTTDGCIFGCAVGGAVAPNGITDSIQLWNQHWSSNATDILDKTATAFDYASAGLAVTGFDYAAAVSEAVSKVLSAISYLEHDKELGSRTMTYSPTLLAMKLPTVGSSFLDTKTFTNGTHVWDANYSLTLKVSRVG
jgi:hypothetical protein